MRVVEDFFLTQTEVVIFDTEFTTWEGAMKRNWSGENEHRELVQIAAQKINLHTGVVLDSFEVLVKPQINPILSDYFVELTHITQEQIEASGIIFAEAYQSFMDWSAGLKKYSFSQTLDSASDMGVLQENIALYSLLLGLNEAEFGTVTGVFQAVGIDTAQYNSGRLYQAFDLDLSGHQHNAMHDVDSIVASLFAVKERWMEQK